MNLSRFLALIFLVLLIGTIVFLTVGVRTGDKQAEQDENLLVTYVVDPSKADVRFFWKNDNQPFKSIENLKLWLEHKNRRLMFAMNAGMYQSDNSPKGLYIERGIVKVPLDTASGEGNFYLKPNGVFYIGTDKAPAICTTSEFLRKGSNAYYATQSGSMLVVDGEINPAFKPASTNLNIRNGVGILSGNRVVFAMSKRGITFYEFAAYFRRIGCKNALYLDGLVSRTYLPEKSWTQTDGDFGVMIGVLVPAKK